MIGCIGDLTLDISVRLTEAFQANTDTAASIQARRGGSAANVAVEAARLCGSAKFIGVVGSDSIASQLTAELASQGVQVCGPRSGRTACLVALLNQHGEASMLTDRADAAQLESWSPDWLAGLRALHVTSYALFAEPFASAAMEMMSAARQAQTLVCVDASSVAGIQQLGLKNYLSLLRQLPPDVLLANAAEAELLASATELSSLAEVVVTKQGAAPTLLQQGDTTQQLQPPQLDEATDTVGAGDAFAAGLLAAKSVSNKTWHEAVLAGQHAATDLLQRRNQSRFATG